MSDNNTNGGVRSTSVKFTASGKPYGADVFISIESVHEFSTLANDDVVLARQEELAIQLQAQALDLVKQAVEAQRNSAPAPAARPAFQAVQAGVQAPAGTSAPVVVAVANGATPQGDWRSVPSRFGDGQIRFIASTVYSSDQMKADVSRWISAQGIDASLFDIWDERTGPRGAEAGNPIGSVFNIKVKKEAQDRVPEDFHKNAAGRGKFNNDGSIYPYWSKDFEAFLKFGGKQHLTEAGF